MLYLSVCKREQAKQKEIKTTKAPCQLHTLYSFLNLACFVFAFLFLSCKEFQNTKIRILATEAVPYAYCLADVLANYAKAHALLISPAGEGFDCLREE